VVALTTSLGGCIFVEKKPGPVKRDKRDAHGCKPSQHWDGDTCRHNGKGKGARKHDGR